MDKKTYRLIKIPILTTILSIVSINLAIFFVEKTGLKVVILIIALGILYIGFTIYKDCISFNKNHIYIRATLFNTNGSPQGSRPQSLGFNNDEIKKVWYSDSKNSSTRMKLINFSLKGNRNFSLSIAGFTKSQINEIIQRLKIEI